MPAKWQPKRIVAGPSLSLITGTPGGNAGIEAAGDGESKTHRVKMEVYSGGEFRPCGWYGEHALILDLKGMELPPGKSVPFHRDHNMSQVVGHSDKIVAKNSLYLEGPLSGANAHAQEVLDSSAKGFPWKASLGASLRKQPDFLAEGSTAVVNGRRVVGPKFIARKWALLEGSFVSIPADPHTSAIAAGGTNMFREWLIQAGLDPDTLTAEALEQLRAAYDDSQKIKTLEASNTTPTEIKTEPALQAAAPAVDAAAIQSMVSSAIAAEHRRTQEITAALGTHTELISAALAGGWDVQRCKNEAELVDLRASRQHGPAIHIYGSDATPDFQANVLEAAFLRASGWDGDQLHAAYGDRAMDALKRTPRSVGFRYLTHEVLRAHGVHVHAGQWDDEIIERAKRLDRQLQASSSGFSTLSMSGVLSNLANKTMQRAFDTFESVYREFCRVVPHSDFKIHTRYRVSELGDLEQVGPTGEITHTERSEASYTNQVATYARMLAITRVMQRNDDLAAFNDIFASFGEAAKRTLEKSVFTKLLDNTDGFFANAPAAPLKPNALAAGGSSALSPTSLGVAETYFWEQEDELGNPISLAPSILLVPPAKYRDAVNITSKTTVVAAGNVVSGEEVRISNEYVGEFRPVKSPFLSAAAIVGNSKNKWFLLSKPTASVALMEVAFLDGRQSPLLASDDTDFNTLGYQWRVVWDWGVAKMERRAGVYSPGA